jgi:hypothetical protein
VAAIDDPGRLRSAKAAGAHLGLTPKKHQSGETDVTGRISKIGDAGVRAALYEAAHVILTRPVKGSTLRSWAMRVAGRAGMRKAKVALARKLAVILHRMPARHGVRRREGGRGACRLSAEGEHGSGGLSTPAARSWSASPRRGIRPSRELLSGTPQGDHALLARPACSASDPIRWRPRNQPCAADPGQKRDPGDRIEAPKRGLTTDGPLQKSNSR